MEDNRQGQTSQKVELEVTKNYEQKRSLRRAEAGLIKELHSPRAEGFDNAYPSGFYHCYEFPFSKWKCEL